jgi:hypothetical protein
MEITRLYHEESWQLAVWDVDQALRIVGHADSDAVGGADPLAAIRALGALSADDGSALLVWRISTGSLPPLVYFRKYAIFFRCCER